MLIARGRIVTTLLLAVLLLGGCSAFHSYDHGKISRSRLAPELVTLVEMPGNAPSINQRFLPQGVSPKNEHKGFDILVASRTPVLAANGGEVGKVALTLMYGNQVMLNHGASGKGYRLQTRYFHLDEVLVTVGEKLRRGQVIGYSGATGLAGMFPHLHFEVHRLNDDNPPIAIKFLDPQRYWVEGIGKVTCFDSRREFDSAPGGLTYPVPCQGMDWQ